MTCLFLFFFSFLRLKRRATDDGVDHPLFGTTLRDLHLQTGFPMPLVIYNSLEYLKKEGIYLEGIFRKAGSTSRIKKLRVLKTCI